MDRLRLVTISAGGQITLLRDYVTGTTFEKARDTFKWSAPPARAIDTARDRRFAGSRTVAESHDNGNVSWTALVTGATPDASLVNAAALFSDLRYAGSVPRFIEFRPDGGSYSTFFEVRGSASVQLNYKWAQFAGALSNAVDVSIPVAPLPRGLPMDVLDTFATDTTGDYTADSAAITDVAVSGGTLTPVVGAPITAERRIRHTARGYTTLEAQATAHAAPGSTITSFKLGRTLRASSTTYVEVYVDDNGTNSRLRVDVIIAGVRTNRASTNLVARVANGVEFWVRGRIEGNVVYSEYFTAQPTPMATPTLSGTAYTLTSAEQTSLVAGSCGLSWIPQQAAAVVYDLQDEPFTYFNAAPPTELPLRSVIPGDAPALADVTITHSGGAQVPIFAMIGWTERPAPWNMVWNGDFEDTGTDGWGVNAAYSGYLLGSAAITRITSAFKYGSAAGQIVTTSTSTSEGAAFKIYRRFRKGVTYTASMWIKINTANNLDMYFGDLAGTSFGSTAITATTSWVQWTVTWVPTSDFGSANLVLRINGTATRTIHLDGVMAYEGTVTPAVGRHAEGAGAPPPYGVLEAENADTTDITTWVTTADVLAQSGYKLYRSTVGGAETYTAGWWVDPNLLLADDFTLGEIDVEVWAFMILHASLVAPRVILSARPEAGLSFGSERFTAEWGTAGTLLTKPSSASANRFCRLGTITLPVDLANPARWKLWLAASTLGGSSGVFGCDYLVLVPSRARAASPSAKINDATYPPFTRSTSETSKTILSDLRGLIAKPPLAATGDKGLGGTPLELPAGSTDLLVKLGSTVPDDPTSSTATEQPWHNATIHVAVTPRFHGLRSA